jgi:hypothetical protein
MGDSKVHNRFLAISRDGRHGDAEKRLAMSVNNLWWTNATPNGELLRLPHIPDLNVSRLPWLQAAPAKAFWRADANGCPKGPK